MAEFPAMPLWTDAYLGDTSHLTTIEHGAYLLLLIVMWRTKGKCLPNDDKLLARYARLTPSQWRRMRPIIIDFFTIKDGQLFQSRLTDEANAVKQHRDRQAKAGRASALKRKERHSTAVQPNGNQTATPTPTPTPTPNISPNGDNNIPPKPPRKSKWSTIEKPPDISQATWKDFERHRQSKSASITQTVIKGFRREAQKIEWSLEAAIIESIERNWQGFKADWIKDQGNGRTFQSSSGKSHDKRSNLAKAIDRELGNT